MQVHAERSEETMTTNGRALSVLFAMAALFSADACYGRGPYEVTLTLGVSRPSRSIYGSMGRDVLDTVANPGGGISYTPPSISGNSVAYVGVSCAVPSSNTCDQVFHFRAVATGETIVTYRGVGGTQAVANVVDTVVVR
jgi:hypothetical protein